MLELLELHGFDAYRGALVSGFLTLGGLMVTALALFTTRVHDLMGKPQYQAHANEIAHLFPGQQLTTPLRQGVQRARWAAGLCFATALAQLGLGVSAWAEGPLVAMVLAVLTIAYVCVCVDGYLRAYLAWLDLFEKLYREEIKGGASRAG